jgi:hypothetical protein
VTHRALSPRPPSRGGPIPGYRPHELETWKRVFLEAGARGLKIRSDPEQRELTPGARQGRRVDDAARTGRIHERFMRTLKEQCLYLHRFQTLEEARARDRRAHRPLQPRVAH